MPVQPEWRNLLLPPRMPLNSATLHRRFLATDRMIRTFLDGLYLVAGYLAGVFLLIIFLLMMGLSLGRGIGINIPAGDDLASWSMAAMAFLGLAHTFRSGEMIRVGLITGCGDAGAGGSRCSRW